MEPNEYEDAWREGETKSTVDGKDVTKGKSDATSDQEREFADAFNAGEPGLGGDPGLATGKAGD